MQIEATNVQVVETTTNAITKRKDKPEDNSEFALLISLLNPSMRITQPTEELPKTEPTTEIEGVSLLKVDLGKLLETMPITEKPTEMTPKVVTKGIEPKEEPTISKIETADTDKKSYEILKKILEQQTEQKSEPDISKILKALPYGLKSNSIINAKQTEQVIDNKEINTEKTVEPLTGNNVQENTVQGNHTLAVTEHHKPLHNSTTISSSHALSRPLNTNEVMDITIRSFKEIKMPEIKEVIVKLKPEELGQITIRVSLEKGEMTGHIRVESSEIAHILQNNLDSMKQELKNTVSNLNAISVSVNSEGSSNGQGSQNPFQQGQKKQYEYFSEETISYNEEPLEGINFLA